MSAINPTSSQHKAKYARTPGGKILLSNQKSNISTLHIIASAAALACSASTFAAQVDKNELARMAADARKAGTTPVVVHLAPVSLREMGNDINAVKARMAIKANLIIAELGQEVSTAGRWAKWHWPWPECDRHGLEAPPK